MAITGPVPKRSEERIRRNIPEVPIEKLLAPGVVIIPELGLDDPHRITSDLWYGMTTSAQAKYFEPSDWHFARMTLHFLDLQLKAARPSPGMVQIVCSNLSDLLVSEGSRRRLRLEIERGNPDESEQDKSADIISLMEAALRKG